MLIHHPSIVKNGLVICLDAANLKSYPQAGVTWTDLTNRKLNGTLNNSPGYSSLNGGGLTFNGSNTYIAGGNTSFVNGNYTIEVWFKATGVPSYNDAGGAMLFAQSTDLNHGIMIAHSWLNQSVVHANKVNNGLSSANNTAPNNTVCNAVGTWDGTNQYVYINGKLSIQRAYTLATLLATPAYQVGRWVYSVYPRYFNGIIYNTKLYNRSLSANEILQNYNALKGRFGS